MTSPLSGGTWYYMNKREITSYLAGCIDSDGTIGIKKSTYAMRVTGDSGQPTYSERLALPGRVGSGAAMASSGHSFP